MLRGPVIWTFTVHILSMFLNNGWRDNCALIWQPQAQQPFYELWRCIALPAGDFPSYSQSLSVKILTDSRVKHFPWMAGKLPSPCLHMCRSVLRVWVILFKDTFCLPVSFLSCWDMCGAFAALVFSQPVFSACPFPCSPAILYINRSKVFLSCLLKTVQTLKSAAESQ